MSAQSFYVRGLDQLESGSFEAALEDFNQALYANPNHAEAYYQRGLCHYKLGDSQKAIEDFNEVLWLNPPHKMAHLMRGLTRYRLGQSQQAIEDCERIIRDRCHYRCCLSLSWLDSFRTGRYGRCNERFRVCLPTLNSGG